MEVVDRSKSELMVQKAFTKESSFGAQLSLIHPPHKDQKFLIKLGLDVNPAAGATVVNTLCEFPTDFYVVTHDLPSMFSGKLHAIHCRPYEKGRDWYDLIEYFSRKTEINYPYLRAMLLQNGPFTKTIPAISNFTVDWIVDKIDKKIKQVNIESLKRDTAPFIEDESRMELWNADYFTAKLGKWAQAVS